MFIIQATFVLLAVVALICGALFIVAAVQSCREKRMLAELPRLPPDHCVVEEAEKVLFRYQYRLAHGQAQPLDEAL